MLLKDKRDGTLIAIEDPISLMNPFKNNVDGRIQSGEEEQLTEEFAKDTLIFLSGESLPRCWVDPHYHK
ncbi:MAG: acetyltransferase [Snowella sp.]|jgi:hypothetical protein|nr:MAG: acetyltransferase [Snowella sp.]